MRDNDAVRGVMDTSFPKAVANQHLQRDVIIVVVPPIKRLRDLKPKKGGEKGGDGGQRREEWSWTKKKERTKTT